MGLTKAWFTVIYLKSEWWEKIGQTWYPRCTDPAVITVSYLYCIENDMVTVIMTHGDSSVVVVSVVIRDLAWGALKDISTNHIIGPYWHLQMHVWLHHRQHIALDTLALRVIYHIMTMTMQPQQQTVTPPSHFPIQRSVNKHISNRLEYST